MGKSSSGEHPPRDVRPPDVRSPAARTPPEHLAGRSYTLEKQFAGSSRAPPPGLVLGMGERGHRNSVHDCQEFSWRIVGDTNADHQRVFEKGYGDPQKRLHTVA